MKGLDFGSVEVAAVESSEEVDEESDDEDEGAGESGEEEETSEEDEEDEEDEEEVEEGDDNEEESEEEVILKAGVPAKENTASKPTKETSKSDSTVSKDADSSSGTVRFEIQNFKSLSNEY